MSGENKTTALMIVDKVRALETRKRAELEASIEAGQVEGPLAVVVPLLITAGISAAVSTASYLISRAFAPKPPRQQIGKLQGSLQLQNSEQGIFIPEIYGAGPTANVVAGSNPTYQNLTNTTSGAGGALTKTSGANNSYNAGASHNVSVSGDAFLKVTPGIGWASAGFFNTASPTGSGLDAVGCVFGVQWGPDGSLWGIVNAAGFVISTWSTGDVFRIELRSGRFNLYKNSARLDSFPTALAIPSFPLHLGVIMFTSSAGVSEAKVQIGSIGDPPNFGQGGIKVPAIIVYSSGIRKNVSVTEQPTGGGKGGGGGTQTVENITYDIDLGLEFCRGPVTLLREYGNADVLIDQMSTSPLPTGVFDPTIGADPTFDPLAPPDPKLFFDLPVQRLDADLAFDGDGVGSGSILGGSSLFAVYPGNATQDPDPTIEADIDARHGTGSTPAYRGHSLIVHKNFSLSRWSGIVPNITAIWEHQTLKTLDDIFADLCERVNVKAANNDYDFTDLSAITSRGMLIAGRLFSPAEVIGSPEIQLAYNYFVTEAEGQLVGYVEGGEPTVTIADTEIGWLDGETDLPDIVPEVESNLAPEISLNRQVDVKYIDPDKEWEPNTQSAKRQITDGVATELLEIQLALLSDEARSIAQKKLYRDYVAGSVHKFTLPWTYLYLYPGYKITITRAEGFTHVLRLTSISGGIGVLECEGVALEPSVFTQPAPGSFPDGTQPPQSIPAMTIVSLLDTPLLRDGDADLNQGVGFYMAGVPRTGVNQSWTGFVLFISRNNTWLLVANSTLPATLGTVVSVTGLNTADPSVFDRTGVIVVDLFGTTATLESVTEQDVLSDANRNLALFGNMVGQFVTATQVADFPNRWSLSVLLNGRRGTEDRMNISVGARFVLINSAVVFVPAQITDINSTFTYRAVTSGQSLADAATVSFAWTGETLRPISPVNIRGTRNSLGDLFQEWTRRSRFGAGMTPGSDVPLGEELEQYDVEYLTTGDVLKRTMRVIPGGAQAGIVLPLALRYAAAVSGNNVTGQAFLGQFAFTSQQIVNSGGWVEATLELTGPTQAAFMDLRLSNEVHIDTALTNYYSFRFANTSNTFGVSKDGVSVFTADFSGITVARIRIAVVGSEVRFYWDYLGPGTIPLFVANVPLPLPVTPLFVTVGACKVNNIFVGTNLNGPSVIYSALQQTEDGFTPNVSTIRTRVYQISTIVGRGHVGTADL